MVVARGDPEVTGASGAKNVFDKKTRLWRADFGLVINSGVELGKGAGFRGMGAMEPKQIRGQSDS
jgi:hypothetical protein